MRTKNVLFLVACLIMSLNVKAQDDYLRVTDLSQIQNGSSVVFAARHDSLSITSYYAMKNDAAGKPQGVSFTVANSDDGMILPTDITDNESEYCWTVGLSNGSYTFINPNGDMLGYGSSGTDFVKNGANSTWSIAAGISGDGTSVPGHSAFVITNTGVTNRSIAFRKYSNDAVYEKFAPYANSATNLGGGIYYFYIDIFVKSSDVKPVVSLPKFSPEGGDYTTAQNVTISCETEEAVIYYTLDGKNPTDTSAVYTHPIEINETTTIKAFAKKEGMTNSGIVTAKYNIIEAVTVSFYENGNLKETKEVAKGEEIGELPVATAPDGFSFNGWLDKEIAGSTNIVSNMMTANSVISDDIDLYAVFSVSNNSCIEVEASSLSRSDAVVIAISKDDKYYAMSQVEGSNGQPTAYELIVSNGNIMNAVPDDVKWNVAYNNGDMIIYPNEDDENWLYCTSGSNNNAVRIGTNADNNVFQLKTTEINDVVYSDYLYNNATERFVGAYYDGEAAIDWRAYKLTASGAFPSNIKNQTYHFFKSEGISYYCTNVDIPQAQTITTNAIMENVSIVNEIVVENGATLTINGAIACTDADNLVIKDGGQLFHNNAGVKATLEKEIEGYGSTNSGWYTISSPIMANTDLTDVENLTVNNYDLYRYDEPTSVWQNAKVSTNNFTTLESGRGYLYANEYDVTLSFEGELAYEEVSCHLGKTDYVSLPGFHLIGNPFAHNIYKGKGAAIDDDNLVAGYYTLSNSGAWKAKVSNEMPIAPCQGILVKTLQDCDIKIKKVKTASSEKSMDKGLLSVTVKNDDYEDVAFVMFDGSAGLEKINHQNEDIPMIYIPIDNVNYAVATFDNDKKDIPVSFKAKTMGEYTIKVFAENKELEYLYLVDNQTGNITNMLVDDYTFIATSNDEPERFVIKLYDIDSVDEMDGQDVLVYISDGKLIITNVSESANVEIFDVMGRKIVCKAITATNDMNGIDIDNLHTGVYIVRIKDDRGIRMQKIIVE